MVTLDQARLELQTIRNEGELGRVKYRIDYDKSRVDQDYDAAGGS